MRVREGEERLGVRFIMSSVATAAEESPIDSSGNNCNNILAYETVPSYCMSFDDRKLVRSSVDNDVTRLSSYTAVRYTNTQAFLPNLGVAPKAKSEKKPPSQGEAAATNNNSGVEPPAPELTIAAIAAKAVVDVRTIFLPFFLNIHWLALSDARLGGAHPWQEGRY